MPPMYYLGPEQALQIPINTSTQKIFPENPGVRNVRRNKGFQKMVIM